MPSSTIKVQSNTGRGIEGKKVTLSFNGGQAHGHTNRHGEAIIDHSSAGEAKVYVDGRNQGTFRAPGRFAVTL